MEDTVYCLLRPLWDVGRMCNGCWYYSSSHELGDCRERCIPGGGIDESEGCGGLGKLFPKMHRMQWGGCAWREALAWVGPDLKQLVYTPYADPWENWTAWPRPGDTFDQEGGIPYASAIDIIGQRCPNVTHLFWPGEPDPCPSVPDLPQFDGLIGLAIPWTVCTDEMLRWLLGNAHEKLEGVWFHFSPAMDRGGGWSCPRALTHLGCGLDGRSDGPRIIAAHSSRLQTVELHLGRMSPEETRALFQAFGEVPTLRAVTVLNIKADEAFTYGDLIHPLTPCTSLTQLTLVGAGDFCPWVITDEDASRIVLSLPRLTRLVLIVDPVGLASPGMGESGMTWDGCLTILRGLPRLAVLGFDFTPSTLPTRLPLPSDRPLSRLALGEILISIRDVTLERIATLAVWLHFLGNRAMRVKRARDLNTTTTTILGWMLIQLRRGMAVDQNEYVDELISQHQRGSDRRWREEVDPSWRESGIVQADLDWEEVLFTIAFPFRGQRGQLEWGWAEA